MFPSPKLNINSNEITENRCSVSKLELWRWVFSSDWTPNALWATGKAFHSKALPQLTSHDFRQRN